ncbi:MAG: hypothetical protein E7008_02785 [Alphaproteobacteria bacterium]|nr:hypothetical protein [Alphaproteobacteria bacterium]
MKVKNIMFSGAMAAILGVTGANAAVTVASQGYVDSKIGEVSTSVENITNNYLTKEAAADTYLTETQVSQQITNVIAAEDGAVATAQAAADKAQDEVDALEEVVATKANAADVYTKTEANELLATKADVDSVYAKTQTYTQDEVKAYVSQTLTDIGEGNISLEGYAKTQDVNNALALKADKTQVATDIANAVAGKANTADVYSKTDADSTFATKTALSDVDAKFADYTTTAVLNTTLADYAKQSALTAEETARKEADQAATSALSGKQDTLTEGQLAAVNSGVTTETVAQVATNTEEIAKKANADTLTLLATANVPEECQSESNTCVLSMTSDGTFAWTPLTATPTASN